MKTIRTLAVVAVVTGIAAALAYAPLKYNADAAAATSETVVIAPFEYFPAQFPTPKGEPEAHIEAF